MYGPILTEAPEGFVPYHQWPKYDLASDAPGFVAPRLVGRDPVGMYRRLWPIVVEEYISDKEPVLADSDPEGISNNRGIIWQRIFRTDIPPGWRTYSHRPRQHEGFATLDDATYWKGWSESGKRYRKKWHGEFLGKEYVIERVTPKEFDAGYMQSTVAKKINNAYTKVLARKIQGGAGIELWGARHIATGELAAGMATITSRTHRASYYLCGFILEPHANSPVMLGLMDHWHTAGLEAGLKFLHFGRFWQTGDPKEWQGFSTFKSKFGLQYISYPPALWRLKRGKLF